MPHSTLPSASVGFEFCVSGLDFHTAGLTEQRILQDLTGYVSLLMHRVLVVETGAHTVLTALADRWEGMLTI